MSRAAPEFMGGTEVAGVTLQDMLGAARPQTPAMYGEVQMVTERIDTLYEVPNRESLVVGGVDVSGYVTRDATRGLTRHLNEQTCRMLTAGAALVTQYPEAERRPLLADWFKGKFKGPLAEDLVDLYIDTAVQQAAVTLEVCAAGERWLGAAGLREDQPETEREYDVIKLLIADKAQETDEENRGWSPSGALNHMVTLADPGLHDALSAKVHEGRYDRLIARDVLDFIATGPQLTNGLAKIGQLVQFFSATLPRNFVGDRQAYVHERMLAALAAWPADQQRGLQEVRLSLAQHLDATGHRSAAFVQENLAAASPDPEATFRKELGLTLSAMARVARPGTYSKATLMKVRADRKRAKKAPAAQPEQPAEEPETEYFVPWAILRLKGDGMGHVEEVSEDNAPLDSVHGEYLKKYGYQPGSLMDDAARQVLDNLPKLDFSTGHIPGVKRLVGQVRPRDTADAGWPLFEYKPMEAAGTSSSAQRAKKLRVLFAMLEDHRLGVIAMLERDDMLNYLRNNGIGPMVRRHNK